MSGPWHAYVVEAGGDADRFESFDEAEEWAREMSAHLKEIYGNPRRIVIQWGSQLVATVDVDALDRIWTDLCYADELPTDAKREINIVAASPVELRFAP